MIVPSKHEKLQNSIIVLGSEIIVFLKDAPLPIEHLYRKISHKDHITIKLFFDTLLFLWSTDVIRVTKHMVFLRTDKV